MLKTEFEALYGKHVTDEQYKDIERLYMASNLMKDEFVNEFKKLSKAGEVSPLLLDILDKTQLYKDKADERKNQLTKLGKWLISISDREMTPEEMDNALRAKALEVLEETAYLMTLLDNGSPLRESDRELMKGHI